MKRAVVFGIGENYVKYESEISEKYEIVCLVDNDKKKQHGYFFGKPILSMDEMLSKSFDCVLVVPNRHRMDIIRSLLNCGIAKDKIIPWLPNGGRLWKDYGIHLEEDGCYAHFDDVRFVCRTTDDFQIMDEIFIFNAYDFYLGEENLIAIDIGMNVGLASLFFASKKNIKKVYSFEPFPKTYMRALENIEMNAKWIAKKIKPVNIGLGNKDSEYFCEYDEDISGGNSVLFLDRTNDHNSVPVQIRDAGRKVGEILAMHPDERIIVKIDTEGSEYDIFSSMKKAEVLEKIYAIIMESHRARENEIRECLMKYGFCYFDHIHFHNCSMFYAINQKLR